jgi:Bacterial alpha-L-rhamnosidase C-terminal domain/Bacterial alpha-L-rhamnosidase 6 hairpin glycosidase domain
VRHALAIPGLIAAAVFSLTTSARAGSFTSSDPQLNAIWAASVRTADDMLSTRRQTVDALGRPCVVNLPVVIEDGLVRDRCPYIGDLSVTGATYDVSSPHFAAQRALIQWFGDHQLASGAIPASPVGGGRLVLFDYNAYWLQSLYRYVLYSGDVALAREMWPHVMRLMTWYDGRTLPSGLLAANRPHADYAFIRRHGRVVSYFNAQYVLALRETEALARWIGQSSATFAARIARVARAFDAAFWDPAAGAYGDTTLDRTTHPQDGNAFAILAGLAGTHARSILDHLQSHDWRSWGSTIVDDNSWDDPVWGYQSSERCYPFISYDEVVARFEVGLGRTALDLIRLEWGYMLANGPQTTMWELIEPFGGGGSWDAGWSSGAAPALTDWVLGVRPTSPGFRTFVVNPHVANLASASGSIDTPRGPITVSWRRGATLTVKVNAPPGETWTNAATYSRSRRPSAGALRG